MEAVIVVGNLNEIDFAPANEYVEIYQNVKTIISTPKFSVPLHRDFGVNADYVDAPIQVAKAKAASEIIQAIRKYEPRVKVSDISWEGDAEGLLKPKVRIAIDGAL